MGFVDSFKKFFGCVSKPKKRDSKSNIDANAPLPKPQSLALKAREGFRSNKGLTARRKEERNFIDSNNQDTGEYCFLSKAWHQAHQKFLSNFMLPGPIDNQTLYDKDVLKDGLRHNCDYFTVNKTIYMYLLEKYGGDPPLIANVRDIYSAKQLAEAPMSAETEKLPKLPSRETEGLIKRRGFPKRNDSKAETEDCATPSRKPERSARDYEQEASISRQSRAGTEVPEGSAPARLSKNLLDRVQRAEERPKMVESKLEGGRDSKAADLPSEDAYAQENPKLKMSRTLRIAAGFQNPSNYCFMNSALQCLLSIPPFVDYFLSKRFRRERASNKTPFCEAMSSITDLYFTGEGVVRPSDLWNITNSRFPGGRQHDLPEFLRYLQEGLETELKKRPKFEATWEAYTSYYNGMLLDTFCGQIVQDVSCRCGHVSRTHEIFTDLALDLEPTLMKCLETYTKPEKIEGYRCEGCKKQGVITKQIKFSRLPNFLVLQIKRFESFPYPRKSDKRVKFEERMVLDTEAGIENFSLIAIAVHSGSLGGGHYVSYGFRSGEWYSFNDSSCVRVSLSNVLGQQAYLLVYMKV
mmetsp:Transcript_16913/g.30323  ORF Transcript_16913/g.30323 Transcript_16913/m.30323 type:complete len:579 (+) Transcript_16913:994-2730(+)